MAQASIASERHDVSAVCHPLGSTACALLSSVFGPYAQDDEYGSRTMNPMELYHNQHRRLKGLLRELYAGFGLKAHCAAAVGGPYALWHLRREEKRLARGWTYEPPTFYEMNYDADQDSVCGKNELT
jgi:hypothetical protein